MRNEQSLESKDTVPIRAVDSLTNKFDQRVSRNFLLMPFDFL